MAFRRRRTFPKRRRGPRIRKSTEPTRWETCNFFFDSVDDIDAGGFLNESVELFKIQDHIGGAAGSAVGRSLAAISRRIEIGGVVFSHGVDLVGTDQISGGFDSSESGYFHGIYLVTDRLDAAGLPVALPDWTTNQAPIATAPSAVSDDDEFPMRVHWRDQFGFAAGAQGLGQTSIQYANWSKSPHPVRTESLRIRRWLDDEQGLYFQFYDFFNGVNADAGAVLTLHKWVWGTVYYRWRF